MAIRTIFSMAEDCARGEREGWEEFVRDFGGIAHSLLAHYFPMLVPKLDEHVVAVFRRAGGNRNAPTPGALGTPDWFAGLSFTNEREFMMAFRDLVVAYGRELACAPAPPIALDQLRAIMQGLMLLERELLWLFIKGYDAQRIAAIMMNAAATAEAVQRVAEERLAAMIPGAAPEALTQSARALMEMAEQSKTDSCVSLKTFNNLVNGQITWRERELAEEHMSSCFYCIDRFTTFQEMVRLRKDTSRLAAPQIGAILAQLPLAAGKPRGVLSRLFAGR
ncbi:MAG: hypothetical protein WA188_21670 [Terriglobales bacterium]